MVKRLTSILSAGVRWSIASVSKEPLSFVSSMMRFLPTLLDSVVSLWKRARTSCLFDAQVGLLCEKAYNVTDQMSA